MYVKSKWNIYRGCGEFDQGRSRLARQVGMQWESAPMPQVEFPVFGKFFWPPSSKALGVNLWHKGYDVRLVNNDGVMCTETAWQFAAINLGQARARSEKQTEQTSSRVEQSRL